MATKTLKTRIQLKADTSTNWAKATNFVPFKGEVCFYTDARKFKVGDGTTTIGSLDFYNAESVGEANLTWGGRNYAESWGPLDAALIPLMGSDRLAFGNISGITFEYSTDGGTTWTAYDDEYSKRAIFSHGAVAAGVVIGHNETTNIDKSKHMCRITISTPEFNVYAKVCKFAIQCATRGSTGSYCTIEGAHPEATTWTVFANKVPIGGWPDWNIINTSEIMLAASHTSWAHYDRLRFTFGVTSHAASVGSAGLEVRGIMAYGPGTSFNGSNLATKGYLYTWDMYQNAWFPGQIYANEKKVLTSSLVKSGSGISVSSADDGSITISCSYAEYTGSSIQL